MAARILSRRLTSELHRSHLNSLNGGNYSSALNFSTLAEIPPQNLTNSSTSGSESHFRNHRSLFSFEQLRNFSTQDHDDKKKNTNFTPFGNKFQSRNFSTQTLRKKLTLGSENVSWSSYHERLYPGISFSENQLRWRFISKVYGIVSAQIGLTAAVSLLTAFYPPLHQAVANPYVFVLIMASTFALLWPLVKYQHRHGVNYALLGLSTVCLSLPLGLIFAQIDASEVIEALTLTSMVGTSLTAYSFWATKMGKDFAFLQPFLFCTLTTLVFAGALRLWFFPIAPLGNVIYEVLSALTFSGLIVYDTQSLIKRFHYDDYILASYALYLDFLNMFLIILESMLETTGMNENFICDEYDGDAKSKSKTLKCDEYDGDTTSKSKTFKCDKTPAGEDSSGNNEGDWFDGSGGFDGSD